MLIGSGAPNQVVLRAKADRICRVERRRDFTWCLVEFMRPLDGL
jgi:hypothetical protein